jgi:hypothetical protein
MKLVSASLIAVFGVGVGCGDDKQTSESASAGETTTSGAMTSSGEGTEMPTTGEAAWRRICDGSQSLRLAVHQGGGGDNITSIAYELGRAYLYVRGDCRYWVVTGERPEVPGSNLNDDWQFTRTGVLAPDVEQALSQELHYDQWTALAGNYGSGESDGGATIYSDGESTLWCDHACGSGPGPVPELALLNVIASNWLLPLWDAGEPLGPADPIQLDVLATEEPEPVEGTACALEWPFDLDPATIARVPFEEQSSRPIVDPELAQQLRALRDDHLAQLPPDPCNPLFSYGGLIYFRPSAPLTRLHLWFRDRLPLEQSGGGIPLPPPPT